MGSSTRVRCCWSSRAQSRTRARAKKDGKEGWVTIRGNAGSMHAEESGKEYVIAKPVPLQSDFAAVIGDGALVRMLVEKEVLEILEGPREEKTVAVTRMKVRAATD